MTCNGGTDKCVKENEKKIKAFCEMLEQRA